MGGIWGLLAFSLLIAAQFVAVIFVWDVRSERAPPADRTRGTGLKTLAARLGYRPRAGKAVPCWLVPAQIG